MAPDHAVCSSAVRGLFSSRRRGERRDTRESDSAGAPPAPQPSSPRTAPEEGLGYRWPPHRARVNLAADRRGKRPAARVRTPEAVERKTTLLPGPPPRLHPPPFLCVKRARTPGKR